MTEVGFTFKFEGMPTPADLAGRLKMQANILEGLNAKEAAKDDTPKTSKKAAPAKKAAKAQDDEETFDMMGDTEAEEIVEADLEEETVEDEPEVDEAAEFKRLAKAFRHFADTKGVDKAKEILKKLKVKSVKDIPLKGYAAAFKALGVKA